MNVILKGDVPKLGKAGDTVKIKEGYARNYLIPKGLALEVTPANLKTIEIQHKQKARKELEHKQKAEELASRLVSVSCTVAMAAGEEDKLFGTVTHAAVAEALSQEGISIEKRDIVFEKEINKLGIYYFNVKLHPEVTQRVKLWVVKK